MKAIAALFKNAVFCAALVVAFSALGQQKSNETKAWELNDLATQLANRGKPVDAIRYYNEAVRLNPKAAVYYNNRAGALASTGETDLALADYAEAIKREPTAAVFYNNRGSMLLGLSRFDRAIADFDIAIQRDPKTALYHLHRAKAYDGKGETAKAIADLEAALRIDRNFTAAQNMLALLKLSVAESKAATAAPGKAVAPLEPLGGPQKGEGRYALVVGINEYPGINANLKTAVNDATSLTTALRKLGFGVWLATNPTRADLQANVDAVAARLKPGDTVFFYFAGHAISPDGTNLLLPSDMPDVPDGLVGQTEARSHSVPESDVLRAFSDRLTDAKEGRLRGLIIYVADACRDNPLGTQRLTRTLDSTPTGVTPKPAAGVFSIYSAGSGQTALDRLSITDTAPNSVFTRVFIARLAQPGHHLAEVAEDVKAEVAKLAATVNDPDTGRPHLQSPAYYNETQGGRIYLAGSP